MKILRKRNFLDVLWMFRKSYDSAKKSCVPSSSEAQAIGADFETAEDTEAIPTFPTFDK